MQYALLGVGPQGPVPPGPCWLDSGLPYTLSAL
jgi:hypothetical protein